MTKIDPTLFYRRRRCADVGLTLIDDAVMIAVDQLDATPDDVRDRVDRMLRWLGGEDVEPGERCTPAPAASCH